MKLREKPEVIIAWINGETVQCQHKNGEWRDFPKIDDIFNILLDDAWTDFRIKPKEIVTTTRIERDFTDGLALHRTYSHNIMQHNLLLTWSPDGKTLLKAEVI